MELTNVARVSRWATNNWKIGMDSNRTNLEFQARGLINEFKAQSNNFIEITPEIIGGEIDKGAKRGGQTKLVRKEAGCETPEPPAWRHAQSSSNQAVVIIAGVCPAPRRILKLWQMT